jgi:cleavage and polyadenylation specificity factor subunit 1
MQQIDYLGHRISPSGVKPLQDKLTAIKNHPPPKNVAQLQTYLGMVNFYRRFFPAAPAVLRPLDSAQQKYSAFDRELLACYLSVRHFRWMLEGRSFFISTDHKPLTFALHRSSDARSARQQRHLAYVAEYTSDIRHVPGRDNKVADALSRPAAVVAPGDEKIDFVQLAQQQEVCPDVQQLCASPTLQIQHIKVGERELICDTSTGAMRPLVPTNMRRAVFAAMHQLSHPGT